MEKSKQRLNLLFSNNQSLLDKNTGLRLPVPQTDIDPSTNKDQEAMAVTSQAVATAKTEDESQTNESQTNETNRGTKEDDCELVEPERRAFESGIVPQSSVVVQSFCPAVALAKLPYKYMRRNESSEVIGKQFFDQGKFWSREWDLYYIFPPPTLASRPLLLLPASQVQELLEDIEDFCNVRLTLPTNPDLGLLLCFQDKGIPQPCYLGHSSSRAIKDQLVIMIPQPENSINCNGLSQINDGVVDDAVRRFYDMMEASLDAIKAKSKASRLKKRAERIERQRQWAQSLKRAQCYLGLHPHRPSLISNPARGIGEAVNPAALDGLPTNLPVLPALHPGIIAPFSSFHEPIFICIDFEWNERRRNEVTEVGISTLDTLDVANVAPGAGGNSWFRWIRSRHLRIREYAHFSNQEFVTGCPDRFNFGRSEFVRLRDAGQVVESCFHPPYSAQFPVKFVEEMPSGKSTVTIESTVREYKLRPRNIILVGHGLQGDMHYLDALGCKMFSENSSVHFIQDTRQHSKRTPENQNIKPLFLDTLDTATMFQVLKRDVHPRSLESILNSLDIVGSNFHNAGNDARYTLEAMVRITLNARLALDNEPPKLATEYMDWAVRPFKPQQTEMPGTVTPYEIAWKAEIERRVAEAIPERKDQILDDCKIWEIVTGWDGEQAPTADDVDGGQPKAMIPAQAKQQTSQKNDRQSQGNRSLAGAG